MQTLEQELFVFCKALESDTRADAGKLMQVSSHDITVGQDIFEI